LREWLGKYGIRLALVAVLAAIIGAVVYQDYAKDRQDQTVIMSQYTYNLVVSDELDLLGATRAWLEGYLSQMDGNYVPAAKALKRYELTDINVIDSNENVVLVGFWAEAVNQDSDYFDSWDGYVTDGRMVCEWVVKLQLEKLQDGQMSVSPVTVQKPEEYGIETYVKDAAGTDEKLATGQEQQEELYRYQLVDDRIQVTFDGGNKWTTVPAEASYLLYTYETVEDNTEGQKKVIDEGRYLINSQCAYFLYGGVTISGKNVPLTVIYTLNKGDEWVSAQVDNSLADISFGYLNFFSEREGVVLVSHGKGQQSMVSVFYTSDGGENFTKKGETTADRDVTGALFLDADTGFICLRHMMENDDTLYASYDGGARFDAVTLEEQELSDNTDGRFTWRGVYVQAETPTLDSNGRMVVSLSQAEDSGYSNRKLVAQYMSSDKGKSWKYMGVTDVEKSSGTR
jgi:hypothetical protein